MTTPLRVLIVEDSEDDCELVVRRLRTSGYEPSFARVDTVDSFTAQLGQREWDLIIADYTMPTFNGLKALEILQDSRLDLPFLLVSGSIGEETAVAAMKAGAHDYLLKQNLARLGAAISRELREAEVRRERRRAEEALRFIAEAGVALAESLDYQATLTRAARLAVPFLADWCMVFLLTDDGTVSLVAAAHTDLGREKLLHEAQQRYQEARDQPYAALSVIGSGQARLQSQVTAASFEQTWPQAEDAKLIRALGTETEMTVPLSIRRRNLGAISFGSASRRPYGASDLTLAQELARRASISIENARLYQEAQEAIRFRDEFLAVASHELRTPLTALQLQQQSLKRTLQKSRLGGLNRDLAAKLDTAIRQSSRLGRLIDNLLDVSRCGTGMLPLELGEVSLADVVQTVALLFEEALAGAGCALKLQIDSPVTGRWDRVRLEQVVTNLVSNAIKFGPGKPVEITIGSGADTLSVRDHGIGIPPQDRERIFGRFERAVSLHHYGGLGLGLYVTRRIVDAHGGSIRVVSDENVGSTFVVQLPTRPISRSAR